MNKGIVIAGATGEVGKRLAEKLIARNLNTPIYALVRQISTDLPESIHQYVVDFNALEDTQIPIDFDMAYCCLGTTIKKAGTKAAFEKVDYEYPIAFAKWAKAKGCQKFACITSVGANHNSKNFYLQVKGKTEHDLTQIGFSHLWLIRPGLLLGNREEFRLGEYLGALAGRLVSPFLTGKLAKYKAVQMMDVAQVMAELANKENPREGCHVLEGKRLHSEEVD